MSKNNTSPAVGRRRPSRLLQAAVWGIFALVLVAIVGLAQPAGSPTSATTGPAATARTAPQAASAALPATAKDDERSGPLANYAVLTHLQGYKDNPDGLLPAVRWSDAMQLPTDVGWTEKTEVNILNMVASMAFSFAAFVWSLLLTVIRFALDLDVIAAAGSGIDSSFRNAMKGLQGAQIPALLVLVAAGVATTRAMRGKASQGATIIVGAALTVSIATALAVSAAGTPPAGSPAKGSPAYLALKGNSMINEAASKVSSGFGLLGVSDGTDAVEGTGSTCTQYMRSLVSAYTMFSDAKASRVSTSSYVLVSRLWDRSMFDQYSLALFGSVEEGRRIACHQLERNAGKTALEQFAVVGGAGNGGSATVPGYIGMGSGPFYAFSKDSGSKEDQSALFAWAACEGGTSDAARAGWKDAKLDDTVDSKACHNWRTFSPSEAKLGELRAGNVPSDWGLNQGGGERLIWGGLDQLDATTAWDGAGAASTKDALDRVNGTVRSYFGYNGGGRIFAGCMAILTGFAYSAALLVPALGTALAQLGLVFFLALLPYTLMLLAFPAKDGGRNPAGKRMLRLTGSFFAGKAVFITLLAVTVQTMTMLFAIGDKFGSTSAAGDTLVLAGGLGARLGPIWTLIVPVATILLLRAASKALGLGNLMSVSGAAGFATSAVMSGKENSKARGQLQGSLNGKLGASGDKAKGAAKGAAKATMGAGARKVTRRRTNKQLADAVASGAITPEQANAIAGGGQNLKDTVRGNQLQRQAQERGAHLSPELTQAVMGGKMSFHEAVAVAKQQDAGRLRARGTGSVDSQLDDMLGRVHDATGATVPGGPVFSKKTLKASADHEDLRAQRDKRTMAAKLATADATPEQWAAAREAETLTQFETTRANAQGKLFGVGLNDAQVHAEKGRLAGALDLDPDQIVLGSTGAPPFIAPMSRDALTGAFQWPEDLTIEQAVRLATVPANFVEGMSRRLGENDDEYHMRGVLTMQAAGLMDEHGVTANVLLQHGVDVSKVEGQEELLKAMRGQSSVVKLEDIRVSISDEDRRSIDAVVSSHFGSLSQTTAPTHSGHADSVRRSADQAREISQQVQADLASTLGQLTQASPGIEQQRALAAVLKTFDERIPEALAGLATTRIEAQSASAWAGGDVARPDLLASVTDAAQQTKEMVRGFASEMQRQVAEIKLAAPDQQWRMLTRLHGMVNSSLTEHGAQMSAQLSAMNASLDDARQAERQRTAGQARAQARGASYAGGAQSMGGTV